MTGVSIHHGAWVMVGDGEKALFFRNAGDATYPNLQIIEVLKQDNPRTSEQGADRPGRSHSSMGMHRSAMQETNWHKLEKHRFAGQIADVLYTAANRGDGLPTGPGPTHAAQRTPKDHDSTKMR